MKDPANLEQVCGLAPDFVGYILFRGSKRYIGDHPDPALFSIPGTHTGRVGVFVNESIEEVRKWALSGRIDHVQLHGNESPDYCDSLLIEGVRVIKFLDPLRHLGEETVSEYREKVSYLLFDTPSEGYGGSGRKFSWDLLQQYNQSVPFLLSGGIGPGDEPLIAGIRHPQLTGVDLNSGFETEPGVKDVGLLETFIQTIRK